MMSSRRNALAAGAVALMGQAAFGEVLCYEVKPGVAGTNGFIQQTGNNLAYYGDDVHLVSPQQIGKVTIQFTFFTYDAATYTPEIHVDLFNLSGGLPVDSNTADALSYTPIASVVVNNATFTGSNYNNNGDVRDVGVQQAVSFDFTTFNLTLQDFAFAYRDENPAGTQAPAYNFSVFVSSGDPTPGPGMGTSNHSFLEAYPNNTNDTSFSIAAGYNIEASITCVPEPASLGLLALGSTLALRRRKA